MYKALIILFWLTLSGEAFAQNSDTTYRKTLKISAKAMVIVNDSIYKGNIDNIHPMDILDLQVLVRPVFIGAEKNDTTLIITTKAYAIRSYQKKLSAFSKEYKDYIAQIEKNDNNDNGMMYLIDGKGYEPFYSRDKMTEILFQLPATNIAKVEFNKQEKCCGSTIRFVSIVIKDK